METAWWGSRTVLCSNPFWDAPRVSSNKQGRGKKTTAGPFCRINGNGSPALALKKHTSSLYSQSKHALFTSRRPPWRIYLPSNLHKQLGGPCGLFGRAFNSGKEHLTHKWQNGRQKGPAIHKLLSTRLAVFSGPVRQTQRIGIFGMSHLINAGQCGTLLSWNFAASFMPDSARVFPLEAWGVALLCLPSSSLLSLTWEASCILPTICC